VEIETKSTDKCELVIVSGEIDSVSAATLEQKLLSLINTGKRNLAVNLRGVTFISSVGLRALMAAQMQVRKKIPRGRVVISEIPPEVRKSFELVGMHVMFDLYDHDLEALESF
jgi:anti-sigma B factor antagonist